MCAYVLQVADLKEKKLEAQVAELGMTDFVQFVGEIKNEMVYKYYQMADLYVNASESESQGLNLPRGTC